MPLRKNLFLKHLLMTPLGALAYYRLNIANNLKISGLEKLHTLPNKNVLFISNHQTYFADVAALIVGMSAAKWGRKKYLGIPYFMLSPKLNLSYVAARETMVEGGILPKLFALCGAITVQRTWRSQGQDIKREVKTSDQDKIGWALRNGWLVSFPQGTTKPYAPGRKGTAHIIKQNEPIVVPVKINGFRRAFDHKGLRFKKKGTTLSLDIMDPLEIDPDEDVDSIMKKVISSIGQDMPANIKKRMK